jgi:general secretion pathway protein M
MKDWFTQLQPRERILIGGATAFFVFALIVIFGVRPLLNGNERNRQLVADKTELLAELTQTAERLGPQTSGTPSRAANGRQSLVVLVDQTTRQFGLSTNLKRNQPDGTDSIRLRLENAPFDELVKWLGELQNRHGLSAASANIDTAQAPGRVNCNLVLTRLAG